MLHDKNDDPEKEWSHAIHFWNKSPLPRLIQRTLHKNLKHVWGDSYQSRDAERGDDNGWSRDKSVMPLCCSVAYSYREV
jgi:hypothetical protein